MLFLSIIAASLTSCRFEDEDLFDESPALRVEHAADEVKNILVNAENGWVMQYFCGTGVAHFEGFNLFAKFDAGESVLMAGNHRMLRYGRKNTYTEYASLYEMLQEDGLVLAFNTWNDILTPFVDPVSPWATDAQLNSGVIPKDGAGMEGDHNFVVTSYNDNEIITRGERHGAQVRLVKCDRTWEEYIAACNKMAGYVANTTINSYYIINSTDTLYLTGLRNGRVRYSERLSDPLKNDSLASLFTPNGLRFERETAIGDAKFQEFKLAEDSTCLVSEDGQTQIIATWDTYLTSIPTLMPLDPTYFTAEQQSLYDQISAEFTNYNKNASLASISLGRSSGNKAVKGLVLTFYSNAAKTRTNTTGLELVFNRPAYGKLSISCPEDANVDANMSTIVTHGGPELERLARAFAATISGEFDIVPNNYFLPTGGVFTPVGSSSASPFKLN